MIEHKFRDAKGRFIKGAKMPIKYRIKSSKKRTGYKHSELTKQKIGNSNRGKVRSAEICRRISEQQKGRISWNKGLKKETGCSDCER